MELTRPETRPSIPRNFILQPWPQKDVLFSNHWFSIVKLTSFHKILEPHWKASLRTPRIVPGCLIIRAFCLNRLKPGRSAPWILEENRGRRGRLYIPLAPAPRMLVTSRLIIIGYIHIHIYIYICDIIYIRCVWFNMQFRNKNPSFATRMLGGGRGVDPSNYRWRIPPVQNHYP